MFGFLESFKGAFYGALGAAAALSVAMAYDKLIDDPLVRREALNGYVLRSERDALASQLATERQRALAAAQIAEEARKRLTALSEANRTNREQAEQDIAEDNRNDDGARVSRGDLEWLRNR